MPSLSALALTALTDNKVTAFPRRSIGHRPFCSVTASKLARKARSNLPSLSTTRRK